jgi:hypothetical protein
MQARKINETADSTRSIPLASCGARALIASDSRLGRDFRIAERQTVEAALDIFNITNRSAAQQFVSGANQVNKANYNLTQNVQLPPSAQASVRWKF